MKTQGVIDSTGFVGFLNTYEVLLTLSLALLTTILWGIYVYYTRKTFLEIKRQTDLQSQAYLVTTIVDCEQSSNHSSKSRRGSYLTDCHARIKDKEINHIHAKWSEILKNNAEDASQPAKQLILRMSNRGNSDIIYWKISLNINIKPGDYLSELQVSEDASSWVVESSSESDVIQKDSEICVSIAEFGNFPIATLTWDIEYKDMRDNTYTEHIGTKNYDIENTIVLKKTA